MSDVQLKRKVTLKEKRVVRANDPITTQKKSKTWFWILLGIVVAAIIVAIVFLNSNSEKQGFKGDGPTTEQVESQPSDVEVGTSEVDNSVDIGPETSLTSEEMVSDNVENNIAEPTNKTEQPRPQQSETAKSVSPKLTSTSPTKTAGLTGDVERDAMNVIRGDFGNGQARKEALGSAYSEIQNRVNAIYREKNMNQ